ncbi:hypothetical protein IDH44_12585 [Paenibacillus sp. IB182496]|uniref:Uncharacterized protein n=1 Tax=Paenibacillus sabuli TaxID=2772509 RepID=A0A927BV25_9BACL|nr:hypothetical protein [Paenibacillus sabuli]MBD2846034.1 hypothetical protein [Paenibacillus sabuli]
MPKHEFKWNARLQIELPALRLDWEAYDAYERAGILAYWEDVRGRIPDLVAELERRIDAKQTALSEEDSFEAACRLNAEIAELASRINDLHIWYRINQEIEPRRHSG